MGTPIEHGVVPGPVGVAPDVLHEPARTSSVASSIILNRGLLYGFLSLFVGPLFFIRSTVSVNFMQAKCAQSAEIF